ncbi:MAG: polymer-forming cytoskeletal protein [Rickettsiales bacterium]|nr:polymer-forming cytoskeletal protein [Rickettsiales bacterium]
MALITKELPSVIAKGVVIVGNISNGNNIEIEGNIEGDVIADIVTIREGGSIKGNVKCKVFNIKGSFNGNANAEKINISDLAVINGLLEYNFLSADYGASINCELKRFAQEQKKIVDILKHTDKNSVENKNVAKK